MAALHQSRDPDPAQDRPLAAVRPTFPESRDGDAARGIVVGLLLSAAGFWLPATGLVLLLLRLR